VSEFQKGDQVAIPNDATNQARALFVLQGAGLIKFTGDPKVPTPDDVDITASTVKVVPVEASQTAALIKELAGVVVNNNFAKDAGLPLSGFVYADDPASAGAKPYINVFVARPEDVNNKTYLRIVELYHNPEVLKSVVESSGGTAVIVKGYDGAALRQILADTQANLKAVG
jgi:D-methionine transport system substrate-binding protein